MSGGKIDEALLDEEDEIYDDELENKREMMIEDFLLNPSKYRDNNEEDINYIDTRIETLNNVEGLLKKRGHSDVEINNFLNSKIFKDSNKFIKDNPVNKVRVKGSCSDWIVNNGNIMIDMFEDIEWNYIDNILRERYCSVRIIQRFWKKKIFRMKQRELERYLITDITKSILEFINIQKKVSPLIRVKDLDQIAKVTLLIMAVVDDESIFSDLNQRILESNGDLSKIDNLPETFISDNRGFASIIEKRYYQINLDGTFEERAMDMLAIQT